MFIIVGAIVVLVSLVVGFMMAGGHLAVLFQPSEFVIIGGAAIGSLLISASLDDIKNIIAAIPKAISHKHHSKEENLSLLKALYELFLIAQRDGLLAIEKHIENPEESDVFKQDAKLMQNQKTKH